MTMMMMLTVVTTKLYSKTHSRLLFIISVCLPLNICVYFIDNSHTFYNKKDVCVLHAKVIMLERNSYYGAFKWENQKLTAARW